MVTMFGTGCWAPMPRFVHHQLNGRPVIMATDGQAESDAPAGAIILDVERSLSTAYLIQIASDSLKLWEDRRQQIANEWSRHGIC